jgi:hypothetical protein
VLPVASTVVAIFVALCLPIGTTALIEALSEREWVVAFWGIFTTSIAGTLLWNRKQRDAKRTKVLLATLPIFAILSVIAGVMAFVKFAGWSGLSSLVIFLIPSVAFTFEGINVALKSRRTTDKE